MKKKNKLNGVTKPVMQITNIQVTDDAYTLESERTVTLNEIMNIKDEIDNFIEQWPEHNTVDEHKNVVYGLTALVKKWALEMVNNEDVGGVYDFWEGENPYPAQVVRDVQEDIIDLIEESTK